jgi:hypothetical protein
MSKLSLEAAQATLAAYAAAGNNESQAARNEGISRQTFQTRLRTAKLYESQGLFSGAPLPVDLQPKTPVQPQQPLENKEKLRLEDRIRSLEKELRERDKSDLSADKISSFYFNLKDQPIEEPDWLLKPQSGKSGVAGIPVTHWSDWHFAERVDPKQVEGANEFNLAIFERRFNSLVTNTLDLCFNHMTGALQADGAKYPGIVVCLNGDLLSGNIHEELAQTNEMETIPAVLHLTGRIAWGLRQYADKFGRVFVTSTPGNHGRNTKKPQAKNACFTSFDWMIGKMLQAHFADDDRVTFLCPDGFDAYFRVLHHRFLVTHGDRTGAKGGDGFIGVIGPIMRGAAKLRLSYAARGREIDTVMMGHWHNSIPLPGLRVNNCLKGYDEWAMSMRFTPTPPSQDLFFVHPKRDITANWTVQLEKSDHGLEGGEWVSVK